MMTPKSDDDIETSLSGLNALDRLKKINEEGLDDKFRPSDDEIIDAFKELGINYNELSPLDKVDKIKRYDLSEEFMPSDEEIQKCIDGLSERIIRTTYQTVTPESAEQGDYADQGWHDEKGESMIPDDWEYEEKTVVDKAVEFITDEGGVSPSSSPFMIDTDYSTASPVTNYLTGEETYYTFHLYGFTEIEQKEIYERI